MRGILRLASRYFEMKHHLCPAIREGNGLFAPIHCEGPGNHRLSPDLAGKSAAIRQKSGSLPSVTRWPAGIPAKSATRHES
jgi:hypothetical protein